MEIFNRRLMLLLLFLSFVISVTVEEKAIADTRFQKLENKVGQIERRCSITANSCHKTKISGKDYFGESCDIWREPCGNGGECFTLIDILSFPDIKGDYKNVYRYSCDCLGSGPTATPTPPNLCGNNAIDPGEECDGDYLGDCQTWCQVDCKCAPTSPTAPYAK